jgi:hypothetical protein
VEALSIENQELTHHTPLQIYEELSKFKCSGSGFTPLRKSN